MNTTVKLDLQDLREAMESLFKQLDSLSLKAKVDVGAHLNAVIKTANKIDAAIKDAVKERLEHERGYVMGESFKAYLNTFPVTRVDQKVLEVEHPRVYAKCLRTKEEERVTYEVR